MNLNPNCEGTHCTRPGGETRFLPYGGDGNSILCLACFIHELSWRRQRNRELGEGCKFALPGWNQLAMAHEANPAAPWPVSANTPNPRQALKN